MSQIQELNIIKHQISPCRESLLRHFHAIVIQHVDATWTYFTRMSQEASEPLVPGLWPINGITIHLSHWSYKFRWASQHRAVGMCFFSSFAHRMVFSLRPVILLLEDQLMRLPNIFSISASFVLSWRGLPKLRSWSNHVIMSTQNIATSDGLTPKGS